MAPDPQRLAAVPGRPSPKRLGKLPIYIGIGVVTVVGLVPLGFVMREIIRDAQVSSATRLDAGPASPGDAIAAEATGFTAAEGPPFIEAAASTPGPDTNQRNTAAAGAGSSPQQPPDVHAQARLRAWENYYQQLAQLQDDRRRGAVEAMRADTAALAAQRQGQTGGGGQQQGQQRPGQPGQAGQAGPGQETRPGDLYQGPVNAAGLYLSTSPIPAQSPYELKGGISRIPFRLDQDISSDAQGQFTATVTKHVMDEISPGRDLILIPQGATLRGVYEDQLGYGSERLPIAITSITYPATGNPACPGREEMPIGSMPGADGSGRYGLRDKVDRHYGRLILNAAIIAAGGAATQLAQPRGGSRGGFDVGSILAGQAALTTQQILGQTVQRDLNVKPTFEARAGLPGTLQLTKTIGFDAPWIPGRGFCGAEPGAVIR
ncbi:hypothetical protein GCM10009416_33750 [Craurococcus roseus]|uniref:Conjugal transfer protein TrbI n=1 Tax=Craurococcus roseus TaxID=77585 RepID=A0ABN1FKA4_9PROT